MIRWKLKAFLKEHGVTPYRLAKAARGELSLNAVYNAVSNDLTSVKFASLGTLIAALREITGQKVNVHDLIEFIEGEEDGKEKRASER